MFQLTKVIPQHALALGIISPIPVLTIQARRSNLLVLTDDLVNDLLVSSEILDIFLLEFRFRFRNGFFLETVEEFLDLPG